MPLEIERKYLDAPLDEIRGRLAKMDATSQGIHFEANMVFDTPELTLLHAGKLLRLRSRIWPDREDFRLTFKGPTQRNENCIECKIREELETAVGSFQLMRQTLINLGFTRTARYEKFRECWLVKTGDAGQGTIKIFLDLLPFAHVVEKESEISSIDLLDRELGLDKLQISTKSYYELNQKWRRDRGLDSSPDFIFEEEQKKHFLRHFGIGSGDDGVLKTTF